MRKVLKNLNGQRFKCKAQVERFGTKSAYRGDTLRTVLLRNVRHSETGELLTDHLWFTCGKWSDALREGSFFEFEARVGKYEKGYKGYRDDVFSSIETDYRLERPTKVSLLQEESLA